LIVLAGYLAFVPDKILEIYENRIISIHPSLIPSFCGRGFYGERVHQAAIHRGGETPVFRHGFFINLYK
jgi:phosphoribosylglycinamide formyltransferase-1